MLDNFVSQVQHEIVQWSRDRIASRHNSFRDVASDVGQTEVASLKAISQPGVINAAEEKHCGVQVVDVDLLTVLEVTVTEFVGAAPGAAALDAAARHPDRKREDVMIAA